MSPEERQFLLQSQQGELDAVLLYQALSELVTTPDAKATLLEIAADEGKHAAIFRAYTGEVLTPSSQTAEQLSALFQSKGAHHVFGLLATGERMAVNPYELHSEKFPRLKEVLTDELKHAGLLEGLMTKTEV